MNGIDSRTLDSICRKNIGFRPLRWIDAASIDPCLYGFGVSTRFERYTIPSFAIERPAAAQRQTCDVAWVAVRKKRQTEKIATCIFSREFPQGQSMLAGEECRPTTFKRTANRVPGREHRPQIEYLSPQWRRGQRQVTSRRGPPKSPVRSPHADRRRAPRRVPYADQ
jgi:hypothetical protein